MKKEEFKEIRKRIHKTQKDFSVILGVSQKTVESYEQGLRNIPGNIERLLYFLLFKLNKSKFLKKTQCWEFKSCPSDTRKNCIAWLAEEGFYCWFLTGKTCLREQQDPESENGDCFHCAFFKQHLKYIM
jgi:transcriptional regulator with XRE-family HTH domain